MVAFLAVASFCVLRDSSINSLPLLINGDPPPPYVGSTGFPSVLVQIGRLKTAIFRVPNLDKTRSRLLFRFCGSKVKGAV